MWMSNEIILFVSKTCFQKNVLKMSHCMHRKGAQHLTPQPTATYGGGWGVSVNGLFLSHWFGGPNPSSGQTPRVNM